MELLAPAGSRQAFEVALAEGADAVYVGMPGCNARALSRDLDLAEIGAMIGEAHERGRKLYLAMNSLIREDELERIVGQLTVLERLGPDGLIIQDLGLLCILRRYFPDLECHGSTLMSVHNSLAASGLAAMGLTRVVLARELTLDEIGAIGQASGVELEVFIHGAMCFSYSGLCLFSSLHGGRSSLRGQCVQPCRRRYGIQRAGRGAARDGGYPFSMNDLDGIRQLPRLSGLGVVCLKIEGRLRPLEYVRNTVRAYRLALDSLDQPGRDWSRVMAEAGRLLDAAMGRRRSPGYLLSPRPDQILTPALSGDTGRLLGRVDKVERQRTGWSLTLRLKSGLRVGDRVRYHDRISDERRGFTVRGIWIGRHRQESARAGQRVRLPLPDDWRGSGGRSDGMLFLVDVRTRKKGRNAGSGRHRSDSRPPRPDRGRVRAVLTGLGWPDRERSKET